MIYVDEPLLEAGESLEAFVQLLHGRLRELDSRLIGLSNELNSGVTAFPFHPAREFLHGLDGIQ